MFDAELVFDILAVRFDSLDPDSEFLGDFPRRTALANELENLRLAVIHGGIIEFRWLRSVIRPSAFLRSIFRVSVNFSFSFCFFISVR